MKEGLGDVIRERPLTIFLQVTRNGILRIYCSRLFFPPFYFLSLSRRECNTHAYFPLSLRSFCRDILSLTMSKHHNLYLSPSLGLTLTSLSNSSSFSLALVTRKRKKNLSQARIRGTTIFSSQTINELLLRLREDESFDGCTGVISPTFLPLEI